MKRILISTLSAALFSGTLSAQANDKPASSEVVIADFKSEKTTLNWKSVNDGVMGGISKGSAYVTEASHLYFKGKISFENNGGFSSIRTSGSKYDLSEYKGIEIRVKGDGRMYYLTTRSNGGRMLAYWSPVQTKKGEWMTVRVPLSSFYATAFGRKIPGMKLNKKKITSVGFMLYDKKDGEFNLEVSHIKAYK